MKLLAAAASPFSKIRICVFPNRSSFNNKEPGIVQESDPYQHLRSIHNGAILYDHLKPWVTHVSLQSSDLDKARDYVAQYKKPVIYDEAKYEDNIHQRWENISAQEMVRRFWLATVRGAYGWHSKTYMDPTEVLWWSKGGVLKGGIAPRIACLRKLVEAGAPDGLNSTYTSELEKAVPYRADWIDPWNMTFTPVSGTFTGKFEMKLPGKPFQAIRFEKVK